MTAPDGGRSVLAGHEATQQIHVALAARTVHVHRGEADAVAGVGDEPHQGVRRGVAEHRLAVPLEVAPLEDAAVSQEVQVEEVVVRDAHQRVDAPVGPEPGRRVPTGLLPIAAHNGLRQARAPGSALGQEAAAH